MNNILLATRNYDIDKIFINGITHAVGRSLLPLVSPDVVKQIIKKDDLSLYRYYILRFNISLTHYMYAGYYSATVIAGYLLDTSISEIQHEKYLYGAAQSKNINFINSMISQFVLEQKRDKLRHLIWCLTLFDRYDIISKLHEYPNIDHIDIIDPIIHNCPSEKYYKYLLFYYDYLDVLESIEDLIEQKINTDKDHVVGFKIIIEHLTDDNIIEYTKKYREYEWFEFYTILIDEKVKRSECSPNNNNN